MRQWLTFRSPKTTRTTYARWLRGEGRRADLYLQPNNPTGSMTKKEDIEWLVANKPAGSVVLIDEAYIHFAGKERAHLRAPGRRR